MLHTMNPLPLLCACLVALPCLAAELRPGAPVDIQPFNPDKWKEHQISTRMVPCKITFQRKSRREPKPAPKSPQVLPGNYRTWGCTPRKSAKDRIAVRARPHSLPYALSTAPNGAVGATEPIDRLEFTALMRFRHGGHDRVQLQAATSCAMLGN